MKTITRTSLVNLLNERGGATPVTILTVTEPKLRKTGNPFAKVGVERETRRNGFVGGSYESIANNKREREGGDRDFTAEPLPWGQHAGRFFITHKGQTYLKLFPVQTGVKATDSWRTKDGQPLSIDDVKPFLPKSGTSSSTARPCA
jgi:hypothetical protein